MSQNNLKIQILWRVGLFIISILFLDWFFFSYLFLKIPNELEWDTSPWYNFLQKKETISFPENKKKVLVTGSSVALYSYLPQDVNLDLVNASIQSDFYSHVAMSPTDFYYYADSIIAKKPDLVLYLINPGDLQMDHFPKAKDGQGFLDYSEEGRLHAYAERHPVKFYYPLNFLMENLSSLRKIEILHLLTKSILYVNRYRSFAFDPIDAYLERHTRRKTSYHNYTGVTLNPIQWRKGWTSQKFEVECETKKDNFFSDTIFIPEKDTTVKVFAANGDLLANVSYTKAGWHILEFNFSSGQNKFHFEVSKVVSSKLIDNKLYGKEYFYGIRLSQNFCKNELEQNIAYNRSNSQEDEILKDMSNVDYETDYFTRMYKDADQYHDLEKKIPVRPEVQRLYHLHNVKKYLNQKGAYRWSEFSMLERAAKKMQDAKIKFVIINNPENPLELNLYKDSIWYKDYLNFFQEMSQNYSIKFYDHKESNLSIQDFVDSHHLTYGGSKKMTKIYSEIIKDNIR
ncbi:MAG TPA: hypothetical protein PK079_17470 [Leptospiraceae bacterium]|nr:hypothetical protein [Leptospiraceae bacterium]HMW06461.1 hypothetical protein [Leptospiraceae bacterium]HMX32437.1 hypothetical protein [Leptospiraceae bacterium]HMY33680.1 hypothetical protein [Leptospiraceae bacterium]HMZ65231.1 hypothetical protein [Leptospiraceae bacterium]